MKFIYPISVDSYITASYGASMWYGKHRGIDIASKLPNPILILAPHDGHLSYGIHYQWGKYTQIVVPGFKTILAHNKLNGGWLKQNNSFVKAGVPVAVMGNTPGPPWSNGRHLHWQVYEHGVIIDPLTYVKESLTPTEMAIKKVVAAQQKKLDDVLMGDAAGAIDASTGKAYLIKDSKKQELPVKEVLANLYLPWIDKDTLNDIPNK